MEALSSASVILSGLALCAALVGLLVTKQRLTSPPGRRLRGVAPDLAIAFICILLGMILASPFHALWDRAFPSQPAFVSFTREDHAGPSERRIVRFHNDRGDIIKTIDAGAPVLQALLEDIDGDGRKEVIVGTQDPQNLPTVVAGQENTSGYVLIYSYRGSLQWAFNTYDEQLVSEIHRSGTAAGDHFTIGSLWVLDAGDTRTKLIAAVGWDPVGGALNRLVILDPRTLQGKATPTSEDLAYDLWHPGAIGIVGTGDLSGDGVPELLVRGVNNALTELFNPGGTAEARYTAIALAIDVTRLAPGNTPGATQAPPCIWNQEKFGEPDSTYMPLYLALPESNTIPRMNVAKIEMPTGISTEKLNALLIYDENWCGFWYSLQRGVIQTIKGDQCRKKADDGAIPPVLRCASGCAMRECTYVDEIQDQWSSPR